ncbi:uncharacterized protein LOC121725735 [Aricia agestis]|uniref:uncharacterized protein LOC121725735 n=1 Tax=Aricia agestis TaxID=91739 RepID=UPI001C205E30|nr:uncharacterized protein LOC121725735 [Aricia agestis]
MASSDVRVAQTEHLKHPYLLALVRWLVSSFWSSATVLLHRLVAAPLPPVTAFPARWKPRPASSDHLHPEPLVQCEVLHTPPHHTLDVIFVHGLYGSLGNTWRQGEWKAKYKVDPVKVPLRRPHSVSSCTCSDDRDQCSEEVSDKVEKDGSLDDEIVAEVSENVYTNIKKIIPKDDIFITEKFYNNTVLDQVEIVGNYDSQAQFVRDLFENDSDVKMNDKMKKCDENINCEVNCDKSNDCQCRRDDSDRTQGCNRCSEVSDSEKCEAGCGCICDECYSSCWPRDWVPADHPGARVISINYTSDPHLWRPLWIKPSKRLQLHERAEQMMSQLMELGVGERPIIWVGHSKGGLFIKQMYCEGYAAYMKMKSSTMTPEEAENFKNEQTAKTTDADNMLNNNRDNSTGLIGDNVNSYCNNGNTDEENEFIIDCISNEVTNNGRMDNLNKNNYLYTSDNYNNNVNYRFFNNADEAVSLDNVSVRCDREEHLEDIPVFNDNSFNDQEELVKRSQFWTRSAGFMFYSVPHRGSPLADIKTPITARSIELMEIAKDCQLVLSLQARWAAAAGSARPAVRSVVETCTTLMSVLWLRIVSVDSADPGIGSLYGVNVDHREICKPSSRRCLLYQELMALMSTALGSYARSE